MMAMAAISDMPLPGPKCPPSLGGEDEYLALMIAEFGLLPPLFAQVESQPMLIDDDEVQATTMAAEEKETQASPPPRTPAPVLPVPVALSPDNQERGKKRKNPPLPPPSTDDAVLQPRPSKKAKKKKLPSRRALNKMVAKRILHRDFCAPGPSQGRTVLRCLCQELPRGSPGCALHQAAAPCRSWMTTTAPRRCVPAVGGAGAVLVPKQDTEGTRAACEYMRWRSRVWMPSRFYVVHAQAEMARLG